jgi:hypothetical protein
VSGHGADCSGSKDIQKECAFPYVLSSDIRGPFFRAQTTVAFEALEALPRGIADLGC